MAALRALLSRMTAPRTERSASRLLGSGFSRMDSVGMRAFFLRFIFAYDNTDPFCRARLSLHGMRCSVIFFRWRGRLSGLDRFPVLQRGRIVRGRVMHVNWT